MEELKYQLVDHESGEVREWSGEPEKCHAIFRSQLKILIKSFYKVGQKVNFKLTIDTNNNNQMIVSKYLEKSNKYIKRVLPNGVRED